MDEHALRVLDFPRLRELLAERATTPMGRARCQGLMPATDTGDVERLQAETAEARRLLVAEPPLSLEGMRDIHDAVWWTQWWPERGVTVRPAALLEIAATAAAARRVRGFLLEHQEEAPHLAAHAAGIGSFPALEEAIGRAITEAAEVADEGSPELARLRREVRERHGLVRGQLEATLSAMGAGSGQVAVRDDRCLLLMAAELRERVPGIVHGASADGRRLLVEPLPVVAANNALGELAAAARAESERVLQGLTGQVKAIAGELLQSLDALVEIDMALARGALGLAMRGERPQISREGHLVLRAARHPLLQGRVVPIDVRLGQEFDMLLVTGPNTGGKTVTLKTVGLLCLMAQAGLQVPAAAGSELPVFPQVFADVGDEQSIEQDLSTFSSHMGHIVRILGRVVPGALVLLDEVGAGTDPVEGAALATVILQRLQERQARVIATTHYPELKAFALDHPRVCNAAMTFDLQTLRPTYHLEIGAVGASQAFAIALRLGLDPELVERAARHTRTP